MPADKITPAAAAAPAAQPHDAAAPAEPLTEASVERAAETHAAPADAELEVSVASSSDSRHTDSMGAAFIRVTGSVELRDWCGSHRNALAMKKAWLNSRVLKGLSVCLQPVTLYFTRRSAAMLELLSQARKKLVQEVPTRWMARHLRLKRLLELWDQIHAVLTVRSGVDPHADAAASRSAMPRSAEATLAGTLADVMCSEVRDELTAVMEVFEPIADWSLAAQSDLLVGGPLVFFLRETRDKLAVLAAELWPGEIDSLDTLTAPCASTDSGITPENRALAQARAFAALLRAPRATSTPPSGSEPRDDTTAHTETVMRAVRGEVAHAALEGLHTYFIFPQVASEGKFFQLDDALLAIFPDTRGQVARNEAQRARSQLALMRLAYLLDLPAAPPPHAPAPQAVSVSAPSSSSGSGSRAGLLARMSAGSDQAAAVTQTEEQRRTAASRLIAVEYPVYMNLPDDFPASAPPELWSIEHSRAVLAWWRRMAPIVPGHGRLARVLLVWSLSAAWMERLGSLVHLRYHVAPSADPTHVGRIVAAQVAQEAAAMWGTTGVPGGVELPRSARMESCPTTALPYPLSLCGPSWLRGAPVAWCVPRSCHTHSC